MLNNRYASDLLRNKEGIFSEIAQESNLRAMIKYYALMSLIFSAIYGLFMGFYSGGMNIIAVAIKVPLLFFGTLAICIPSLFTFNVILGSKLSFKQTVAVSIMATYLLTLILVSLAPIVLFFNLSTNNTPFIIILNVATFSISGFFGVSLLWQCMEHLSAQHVQLPEEQQLNAQAQQNSMLIIKIWTAIYMFVGTQMAWLLRPFFGDPENFAWFREIGGNIYTAILRNLVDAF